MKETSVKGNGICLLLVNALSGESYQNSSRIIKKKIRSIDKSFSSILLLARVCMCVSVVLTPPRTILAAIHCYLQNQYGCYWPRNKINAQIDLREILSDAKWRAENFFANKTPFKTKTISDNTPTGSSTLIYCDTHIAHTHIKLIGRRFLSKFH